MIFVVLLLVVLLIFIFSNSEQFDLTFPSLRAGGSSSAWDWNTGPGYGDGYGNGYGRFGVMPDGTPTKTWKEIWDRVPKVMAKSFIPEPQIDYNFAQDMSKPATNFTVGLQTVNGNVQVAIDGVAGQTLHLDKNGWPYYFHIFTPGEQLVFTDDENILKTASQQDTITLSFTEADPQRIYYSLKDRPDSGGIIELRPVNG